MFRKFFLAVITILLYYIPNDVETIDDKQVWTLVAEDEFTNSYTGGNDRHAKNIMKCFCQAEDIAGRVCDKVEVNTDVSGYQAFTKCEQSYRVRLSSGNTIVVIDTGFIYCKLQGRDEFFIAPSNILEKFFVMEKVSDSDYQVDDVKLIIFESQDILELRRLIKAAVPEVDVPKMQDVTQLQRALQWKYEYMITKSDKGKAQQLTAENEFQNSDRGRNRANIMVIHNALSKVQYAVDRICDFLTVTTEELGYKGNVDFCSYKVKFSAIDQYANRDFDLPLIKCKLEDEDKCVIHDFVIAISHVFEVYYLMLNDGHRAYKVINIKIINEKQSEELRGIIHEQIAYTGLPIIRNLQKLRRDLKKTYEEVFSSMPETKARILEAERIFKEFFYGSDWDGAIKVYSALSKIEYAASRVCDKMEVNPDAIGHEAIIKPEVIKILFSTGQQYFYEIGIIECKIEDRENHLLNNFTITPSNYLEQFFVLQNLEINIYRVVDIKFIVSEWESVALRRIIGSFMQHMQLPKMSNLQELKFVYEKSVENRFAESKTRSSSAIFKFASVLS